MLLSVLLLLPGLAPAQTKSPTHSAATALPQEVRAALAREGIPLEAVSVAVRPLSAAGNGLLFQADRAMNPASVMKLVTGFVALERLGATHVWDTRIAADALPRDGVLSGNLYLIGGGDPVLHYERLWKMLREVRELGVREIRGDLVLDDSALRLPAFNPGAFDGRPLRPYNAGAGALVLNFNALRVRLAPGEGQTVQARADPPLAGLYIDNRIEATAGDCGLWYAGLDARLEAASGAGAVPRLVLSGRLPRRCGARDWQIAPLPISDFNAALVAGLWQEIGGQLQGRVRAGETPAAAQRLLGESSPPLADVVRDMNKWSSNLIARQLLVSLGAGAEDSLAAGIAAARDTLAAAGINIETLVIENGSGLSRIERFSAAGLVQLLEVAWRRPWMPEFVASLPVAGLDGTARRRLANSPAQGHAHIKTGTINEVRAIAGYVLDRHGNRHAVAMLVNHPKAANSRAAQDALLEWIWRAEEATPEEVTPRPTQAAPAAAPRAR